jgi:hypothetical protein
VKRTKPPARKVPLKRSAVTLARKPMKAKRARSVAGRPQAAHLFHVTVAQERCVMCGDEHGHHEAHHAVEAQVLRRICRSQGLSDAEALAVVYDPAFGVALCGPGTRNRCHERHTNAVSRVPRSRLPERVFVAAYELGPEAEVALERAHPDVDDDGHTDQEEDAWTS